jgi:hypothetical protein
LRRRSLANLSPIRAPARKRCADAVDQGRVGARLQQRGTAPRSRNAPSGRTYRFASRSRSAFPRTILPPDLGWHVPHAISRAQVRRVEPRDDHVVAWRHAEDPELPAVVRRAAALSRRLGPARLGLRIQASESRSDDRKRFEQGPRIHRSRCLSSRSPRTFGTIDRMNPPNS